MAYPQNNGPKRDFAISAKGTYQMKVVDFKPLAPKMNQWGQMDQSYQVLLEYTYNGRVLHCSTFLNQFIKLGNKTYTALVALGFEPSTVNLAKMTASDFIDRIVDVEIEPGPQKPGKPDQYGNPRMLQFMNVVALKPVMRQVPNPAQGYQQPQQAQPQQFQQPAQQPYQQPAPAPEGFYNQPQPQQPHYTAPAPNNTPANQPYQAPAPQQAPQPQQGQAPVATPPGFKPPTNINF